MNKNKSGLAFHVHTHMLVEWCWDYDESVDYIKNYNSQDEVELLLKLFKPIPTERSPIELVKAGEAYNEAREAYDTAWKAYREAWKAYIEKKKDYMPLLEKLHEELCPNCPWDGRSIFSERR